MTLVREGAPESRVHSGLRHWLLVGLIIRLLLVPLNQPWDLQTWYDMFVDLAHNHSPYETSRYLTYSTRAEVPSGLVTLVEGNKLLPPNEARFYEYYAYPPLPLLLYYPLAKLSTLFIPLDYKFVVQGALADHRIPLGFMLLFKVPLFLADVGLALLLRRLAGEQIARTFFLNPFVILVSATWMIDSVMTLATVAALFMVAQRRYALAGCALALGALTKWTPGILWPAIGLWLVHQRVSWRLQASFHGAFLLTLAAVVAPFGEGVLWAAQFHALRPGGGLSPHILLYVLQQFSHRNVVWYFQVLSPYIGAITLPLTLGAAYLVQMRRPMPLPTAACLTVVAFLLGSKRVNEPYVFLLLPLLLWENAERPSDGKVFLFRAMYALPLAFAILNPILLFAVPLYMQIAQRFPSAVFIMGQVLPFESHAVILAALAFAFLGLLLYAWRVFTKEVWDEAVHDTSCRPDHYHPGREPAHRLVGQDAEQPH